MKSEVAATLALIALIIELVFFPISMGVHGGVKSALGVKMISWDDDGLFKIDKSMFGDSYKRLGRKLNVKLDKPVEYSSDYELSLSSTDVPFYRYIGIPAFDGLTYTEYNVGKSYNVYDNKDNNKVYFFFYKNKCVGISCMATDDYNISKKIIKNATKKYGKKVTQKCIKKNGKYFTLYIDNINDYDYYSQLYVASSFVKKYNKRAKKAYEKLNEMNEAETKTSEETTEEITTEEETTTETETESETKKKKKKKKKETIATTEEITEEETTEEETEESETEETDESSEDSDSAIWWDEYNMFHIDYTLFGLSYSEICDTLGISMPKPSKAESYELYMSEYDGIDDYPIIFVFDKNDQCSMIISDLDSNYSSALKSHIESEYGTDHNAYISDGDCYYLASMTDDNHLMQSYTWAELDTDLG